MEEHYVGNDLHCNNNYLVITNSEDDVTGGSMRPLVSLPKFGRLQPLITMLRSLKPDLPNGTLFLEAIRRAPARLGPQVKCRKEDHDGHGSEERFRLFNFRPKLL